MADAARTLAYLKRTKKNLRRYEILTVLVDFAKSHNGATPGERALWRQFQADGPSYGFAPMSYYTFLTHMKTLVDDDKLIQKRDGVIVIPHSKWRAIKKLLPTIKTSKKRRSKRVAPALAFACPATA
jgi:hypothetical protein